MPKVNQCESEMMVPFRKFDNYKKKYEKFFDLQRSESGVITAKWNLNGESSPWDYYLHRGIGQLCADVGQDAESEVLILGGAGDSFLTLGKTSLPEDFETKKWSYYEHSYYDGCNMVEGLINDVEQPTIGIINGKTPAVHSEIALLCDITLMSEEATILDPHFAMAGTLFGDGIQIALRAHMGIKRSNYAMLFGQKITAQQALEYGLVNEIVPADKIYERAQELAEQLAAKPRISRRIATQTMRAPLKEQIAKELRPTFGTEMWDMLVTSVTHDEAFKDMKKGDKDIK
jgi:Enoyl-CoA hydratase/carnithine racemase